MNKKTIKTKIYQILCNQGVLDTRENVTYEFTDERIENKMFVRKLPVDIPVSGTTVKMISLASDRNDFSDVDCDDIRIGCVNYNNQWTNLFINEVPGEILSQISFSFDVQHTSVTSKASAIR